MDDPKGVDELNEFGSSCLQVRMDIVPVRSPLASGFLKPTNMTWNEPGLSAKTVSPHNPALRDAPVKTSNGLTFVFGMRGNR